MIIYKNKENQTFDLSNFNYLPAKYVLLPILKQANYDDFGKYYETAAYIVTKGFIKEKTEKININNHVISYKALLPFFVNIDRQIEYDEYGKEILINDVFDNYEEAKKYANEINEEIFISNVIFEPISYLKNNYDKLLQEREETYQKYNELETRLLILTKKIKITTINWGENIEQKTLLKKYK